MTTNESKKRKTPMCSGNCSTCDAIECALKFTERIQKAQTDKKQNENNEKEKDTIMQTNLKSSGCGAPADKDNAVQNAEINHIAAAMEMLGRSTPLTTGLKSLVIATSVLALVAFIVALLALGVAIFQERNIANASDNSTFAVGVAKQASIDAVTAKERAEKNYIYLRDMKRDFREK